MIDAKPKKPFWPDLTVCALLFFSVVCIYWQVSHHEFIGYDDDKYVFENRWVRSGISIENVKWALTTTLVDPADCLWYIGK